MKADNYFDAQGFIEGMMNAGLKLARKDESVFQLARDG